MLGQPDLFVFLFISPLIYFVLRMVYYLAGDFWVIEPCWRITPLDHDDPKLLDNDSVDNDMQSNKTF